jgi:hypothetical protein
MIDLRQVPSCTHAGFGPLGVLAVWFEGRAP